MNILHAIHSLKTTGGFSYSFHTNELNPSHGYMVAISRETEKIVSNVIRYKDSAIADEIRNYILEKSQVLTAVGTFLLGGWMDGGKLYLDVSELVDYEIDAIDLAVQRDQIAYYDNKRKKSITI